MVVHTCNPSYLADADWEHYSLRPAQAKSYWNPITTNKLGMVTCFCDSSYMGGIGRRIAIQAGQPRENWETLSKK
jgi:hypothetical protein